MTAKEKTYIAYSLLEMLIVLSIFIIISLIGFSSFYGMRDAITLNEQTLTLEQDIRYAQRSALFLERKLTDRWIYGIGVDFTKLESTGEYNIFKWCSQFNEYGDEKTKASIPNYTNGVSVGPVNANIPIVSYSNTGCPLNSSVSQLSTTTDTGDKFIDKAFTIDLPASNNAVGDVASTNPVYVLFEAVSGRAFFYDSTGVITNYDTDAKMVSNPIGFVIDITSPRTKTKKSILISNISGKVEIQVTNTN